MADAKPQNQPVVPPAPAAAPTPGPKPDTSPSQATNTLPQGTTRLEDAKNAAAAGTTAAQPPKATTETKIVTTTTPAPPTKPYRLKKGAKPHVHDGQTIGPGGVVHLTEQQFNAFRDKFEPA